MGFKDWFSTHKKPRKPASSRQPIASVEKVYVPVSHLAIGMFVAELDRSWLETPFLFQGFEIKTYAQIQALKNICDYVYIDATKTKAAHLAGLNHKGKSANGSGAKILGSPEMGKEPPKKLGSFATELPRAAAVYENAAEIAAAFMSTAARHGSIDGWLAKKTVADCVNSVLHSPDAMMWMLHLRNKDAYSVQHCLNVCVLSIVFGRHLSLPYDTLVNLGVCGLLHDIGNMLIPAELLNKDDETLTEQERRLLESHTSLGYELLKSSDNIHSSVIETVLNHHERPDGSGYSRRLKSRQVSDFTKIVSVVDYYDNLTNHRFPQRNKNHLDATQRMANLAGTALDKHLVVKFIECLGVYPPGSVVMMTNGAIGVVVEVNEKTKLRPKVVLAFDEHRCPVPEQVLDLAQMPMDSQGLVYTVRNVVRAEDWGVDRARYQHKSFLKKLFDAA